MSDTDGPSRPPSDSHPPTKGHPILVTIMLILGALLLIPGICVLMVISNMRGFNGH